MRVGTFSLYLLTVGLYVLTANACGGKQGVDPPECGNGVREGTEACDGNDFAGLSCEAVGYAGGSLACSQECQLVLTACDGYLPGCGNGVLDAGEECDGSQLENQSCTGLGFAGGTLACQLSCVFDTSGCEGACASDCTAGDARCSGNDLEHCLQLSGTDCTAWIVIEDCSAQAGTCEEGVGGATCNIPCTNPCAPEGATQCDSTGELLQECALDSTSGCLDWTTVEDCGAVPNGLCDASGTGDATCVVQCNHGCTTAGELRCAPVGEAIESCATDGDGCRDWALQQTCTAGWTCELDQAMPTCTAPCVHDCPLVGDQQCRLDGLAVQQCEIGTSGCREWTDLTLCQAGTEVCNSGLMQCVPTSTGDTCTNAMVISSLPFQVSGSDFSADYSDDVSDLATGQDCGYQGNGAEVFWSYFMNAGETVRFHNTGSLDIDLRVMADCQSGQPCLAVEWSEPIFFTAPSTGTYYFVAEQYPTLSGDYDITLTAVPDLQLGDECLTDNTTGICVSTGFCGNDSSSSTGYRCLEYLGGDTCGDALTAVLGHNQGRMRGMADVWESPCNVSSDPEQIWAFTAPTSGEYLVRMSGYPHYMTLWMSELCPTWNDELGCVDDVWQHGHAEILAPLVAGTTYHIFAEGYVSSFNVTDPYEYDLDIVALTSNETGLCNDGQDNDTDGFTDCQDSDCFGVVGLCDTETHCTDGQDEDNDGQTDCDDADCAADPQCVAQAARRAVWQSFWSYSYIMDTEGWRIVFTPDTSGDYTWVATQDATFAVTPDSTFPPEYHTLYDEAIYTSTIPFAFPFYGQSYTTAYISSNGRVTFEHPGTNDYPTSERFLSLPGVALAYEDLTYITYGDDVIVDQGTDGQGREYWAVTFLARDDYGGQIWAQIYLTDDGEIRLDYPNCTVEDSAVGISAGDAGTDPPQVNFIPETENTDALCRDGHDNDNNGLTDCSDPTCNGFWDCAPESTLCGDFFDNDGDGDVDCADSDCFGVAPCGAENTETACRDQQDNDNDGLTDCFDPECLSFCHMHWEQFTFSKNFDLDPGMLSFHPVDAGHYAWTFQTGWEVDEPVDFSAGAPIETGASITQPVSIGFWFPFYGTYYSELYIGPEGQLTFGVGNSDSSESAQEFADGPPAIAVDYNNLNVGGASGSTSGIFVDYYPNFTVIHYRDIPDATYSSYDLDAQVVLHPGGRIDLYYNSSTDAEQGIVGISPGGGCTLTTETDFR